MNRHLAECGGHRDFGSVDISLFICHAASNDHVIKWSNEFASWCPAKSGGNKSCGGTNIIYFKFYREHYLQSCGHSILYAFLRYLVLQSVTGCYYKVRQVSHM